MISANLILMKHKAWLREYEKHVQNQITQQAYDEVEKQNRLQRIKDMAKKDRVQTKEFRDELKVVQNFLNDNKEEDVQEEPAQPKPSPQKENKPKWAMTKEQVDNEKQQNEEELIDFASNLDFEDYLEDFEVTQVKTMLQALKHRVKEIKEEDEAKELGQENPQEQERQDMDEVRSQRSQKSNATNQTRGYISFALQKLIESVKRLKQKMQKEQVENREDWDSSVKGDPHLEYEHRLANKIADEILKRSKALRMIHSKKSIKALIGEEAKAFLRKGSTKPPQVVRVKDHDKNDINQISRAPNLYRNPAI